MKYFKLYESFTKEQEELIPSLIDMFASNDSDNIDLAITLMEAQGIDKIEFLKSYFALDWINKYYKGKEDEKYNSIFHRMLDSYRILNTRIEDAPFPPNTNNLKLVHTISLTDSNVTEIPNDFAESNVTNLQIINNQGEFSITPKNSPSTLETLVLHDVDIDVLDVSHMKNLKELQMERCDVNNIKGLTNSNLEEFKFNKVNYQIRDELYTLLNLRVLYSKKTFKFFISNFVSCIFSFLWWYLLFKGIIAYFFSNHCFGIVCPVYTNQQAKIIYSRLNK